MGFNTTLVLMNDRLEDIRKDPEFGRALADAVEEFPLSDVRPYPTGHGIYIIERHDSSLASVVVSHNHSGECIAVLDSPKDVKQNVMRALAKELGYRIVKQPDTAPITKRTPKKKK